MDSKWTLPLTRTEQSLIDLCDGKRNLASLRALIPRAPFLLRRFADSVVLMVDPVQPMERKRKRWHVVSPHSDDAAISLGGTLYKFRDRVDLTILTLTSSEINPAWERLRILEDKLYARFLGCRFQNSGIKRTSYPGESHGTQYLEKFEISKKRIEDTLQALDQHLQVKNGDTIFAPLISAHPAHMAAHEAMIGRLTESRRTNSKFRLFFYEDLPYCYRHYARMLHEISLHRKRRILLRPTSIDIRNTLEDKMRGIRIYKTQGVQYYSEIAREHARLTGAESGISGALRERIWEALPLRGGSVKRSHA